MTSITGTSYQKALGSLETSGWFSTQLAFPSTRVDLACRAIARDETAYPDPNSFKPERFLEPVDSETKKRLDPRNYVFGAGRRRCPGIHLVEAGLWLVIVRIVSTLDIRKKVVDGVEVEPDVSYDNAFLRSVFFSFLARSCAHICSTQDPKCIPVRYQAQAPCQLGPTVNKVPLGQPITPPFDILPTRLDSSPMLLHLFFVFYSVLSVCSHRRFACRDPCIVFTFDLDMSI